MSDVEKTLAERGNRYGDFMYHAVIAQSLQDAMRNAVSEGVDLGWENLSAIHKQALTVIADKIARILSGDPNYADNWHDIQGYAKLVEDRLPKAARDLYEEAAQQMGYVSNDPHHDLMQAREQLKHYAQKLDDYEKQIAQLKARVQYLKDAHE